MSKRKRKLKHISVNKKILLRNLRAAFVILLAGALIFGGFRFFKMRKEAKLDISVEFRSAENGTSLNTAVAEAIKNYFVSFETGLSKLAGADITALFDRTDMASYENAAVNQLALNTLVAIRSAAAEDLTFKKMQVGLRVEDFESEGDTVTVYLTEDHAVNFACMGEETSYSCGIEHVFKVKISDGGAKIVYHSDGSVFESALSVFEEEKEGKVLSNTTECDVVLSTSEALIAQKVNTFSGVFSSKRLNYIANREKYVYSMEVGIPYDRTLAVEYAKKWCGTEKVVRNPEYGVYDDIGGNCNNFISQCVHAGNIPFDDTGDEMWKYYSDELNEYGGQWGRSSSWTSVDDFYYYCDDNTIGGIAAMTGCNFYSGEEGDIIQIGSDSLWVHSVIITGIVRDPSGNILDYIISSNTVDRRDYPLSAYGVMYSMRLIKIFGSY